MSSTNEPEPPEYLEEDKITLLNELKQREIKHSPEKIVFVVKTREGAIVFLETGDVYSGLQHILGKVPQFVRQGISEREIVTAIATAITEGEIVGYQGTGKNPRPIYQFVFKGEIKYIAISIANNGYIVGANPRSKP
ncbi:MAG: hypothetical protein AAGA60_14030 [Cyanobacteria bacterium P01_E01_bin.42]